MIEDETTAQTEDQLQLEINKNHVVDKPTESLVSNNTKKVMDNTKIVQSTSHVQKETKDNSVICAALDNLKNCCKLKKNFDITSLKSFLTRNTTIAPVLEKILRVNIKEPDVVDWLGALAEYVKENGDELVQCKAAVAFEDASRIGISIPCNAYTSYLKDKPKGGTNKTRVTPRNFEVVNTPRELRESSESEFSGKELTDTFRARLRSASSEDEEQNRSRDRRETNRRQASPEGKEALIERALIALIANSVHPIQIETLKTSSQRVVSWFEKFEIQTADWQAKKRAAELPKRLEGTALYIWEEMRSQDKYDYKKAKDCLIKRLNGVNYISKMKKAFYSASQKNGESVDDFAKFLRDFEKEWPITEFESYENDVECGKEGHMAR